LYVEEIGGYMSINKDGNPIDANLKTNVGEPSNVNDKNGDSVLTIEQIIEHLENNKDDRHKLFYNYKGYQKELDVQKQQHLQTWKKNNLDGLLLERENKIRDELMPSETPAQKEVRRLTLENEQHKKQLILEQNKSKGVEYANSIGVTIGDNIDWLVNNVNEDNDIFKRIDWLSEYGKAKERDGRNKIISEHGTKPETGDETSIINDNNFKQIWQESKAKYGNEVFIRNKALKKYLDEHPTKYNELNR
jgi:hypothetical protein